MLGKCEHCGYQPLVVDAPVCPRCLAHDPNPNGLKMLIRGLVGCLFGLLLVAALIGGILNGIWELLFGHKLLK
jgi:hypothetical protein